MSTRAIASSTLWQLASQVVMAALSVVTVKFVAIGLSKELAGNYNSAYSYLQLFGIVSDFGLYAVSVRELAKADDKPKMLGGLIVLRTGITLLSLGLAIALVWLSPQWRGTPLPLGATVAVFVPFFTLLAGILRTVFQVSYKMHFVFIAEVTQRVITAALIALVVLSGVRLSTNLFHYHLFLAIGGLGAFVLFALSAVFARRLMPLRLSFDRALMVHLLRASVPYGFAFLCVALYRQLDITLIALLRPDYAVQNAYYGFVGRITDMTYLIPTFLLNSTLPILSARHAKGEETATLLGKTFLLILLLGSTSFVFSFFWPRAIIELLTTHAYLSTPGHPGSDTALQLLSLPMFFNGIILFSFYTLLTTHEWRRLVKTMLIGVVISIGCNVWLIPMFGFTGAAITSIATNGTLAILLLPQALKIMPMRFTRAQCIAWLLYSSALGIALSVTAPLLTSTITIVIGLVCAVMLMAGLLWVTGITKMVPEGGIVSKAK